MPIASGGSDPREVSRSNVFLSAVLDADTQSYPVRLRNASARGALLDGANLPAEGARVRLRRGSITVPAVVAWKKNRQLGLRFECEIDVDDLVRKVEHAGQRRVDAVLAGLRLGEVATIVDLQCSASPGSEPIATISRELDQLCEDLAKRSGVNLDLAENVLRLDALAQRLREWVTYSGHSS